MQHYLTELFLNSGKTMDVLNLINKKLVLKQIKLKIK